MTLFTFAAPAAAEPGTIAERPRESMRLTAPGAPSLQLQRQAADNPDSADVIYVHGGTFGADLSVFYKFGGRSWADVLNAAGFTVWGFDFAGYGASDRYPDGGTDPSGRADEALAQLERVVAAVRERNGGRPPTLLAHSWGTIVAAKFVAAHPHDIANLLLFAPIVTRVPLAHPAPAGAPAPMPPTYPCTALAQYRRFVEDVPRGQPQVLDENEFQAWGAQFLAGDPSAATRRPPAVLVPSGPIADIAASLSGRRLYDPASIKVPTLIVRGEWDSLCTDADAQGLLSALAATVKEDARIARATHLMHMESGRTGLYARVNEFMRQVAMNQTDRKQP